MTEHDHDDAATHVRPLRVLVVDPDPTHRLLAVRLLERLGAAADGVGSPADALAGLVRYDVVLVDQDQTAASGFTGLSAEEPGPVVVGLAAGDPKPGFDLVLRKPVSSQELREVLGRAGRLAGKGSVQVEPAVDVPTLTRLVGDLGDPAIVAETIALYLAELPERLAALEADLAAGDAAAVRLTAHSLKSASAMLGARPLSRSCLDVERAAAEGRLDSERLRRVRAAAGTAAEALRDYLAD